MCFSRSAFSCSFCFDKLISVYIWPNTNLLGILQGLGVQVELPEKSIGYEGVFYNYFSIGILNCT